MRVIRESKRDGFTLLETVLYIALLAIMVGGGMVGVYNILEGSGRTLQSTYREQEAYFITRKIDAVLSEAESITEPSEGSSSDQLTVQAGGDSITVDLDGEEIRLIRNGSPLPLNNGPLVPASALNFEWDDASSTILTTFTLDEHEYSVSNYYYED